MQDNKIDEITGLPTRILDAYQKNTGAKDITDNRQGLFNTAEPGGESDSSFQSLDFENLDSYTKRGFNPIYGADNSDLRAQRQDISDKWANGIVKGVGTALTSATESTAGLLYGLGAAIGTIGSDKSAINALYDNDFSRTLDSFNKQLAEAMPNYYRTNEENRSLLGSLGTANFWSDKFLNGAGYAAGAMVTGLGLAKLNMFGKLAGAGKLVGLSEEAIKADAALTKLANSVKFANRAEFAFNSVLMSTGESAAEARQAKDETKQRLLNDILKSGRQPTQEELKEIEDLSDAAGNTAYGLNLIITGGTNALQFGKMLGGGYNANKLALNDVRKKVTKEGVEELGEDGLSILEGVTKTVGKERAKKFGIGFLEEGGQEGLQSSTQFAVSDYYGRKFDKDNPNHDLFTSGIEGLVNTLTTKQGWESILLGGLLGGPMGLHGVAKETKDSNDRTAKAVELINNSSVLGGLKNKVENSIQEASYQKAKDAALERGDIAEYKNLEFQERKSYIKKVIESGGFDLLMDKLESTKGMAPAEFKKAFGIKEDYKLNPKSTIGDTEADVHNHIDEIKKKAVKLKDTYDKIQLAFPFKGSTKEELLSHKILTETLWNASTNIDNIDDREKQIAQHISELTNGTVNVFTGVNQLALREEFGDKYQEEFDKRFEANLKNITNPLIKNEVIAAKKDIDKLAKEREHYIDSYNKLVNSKEEVKKIEAKLEEQIKEIQKQELKKKAKLDEFQEGDFADVEVPISKNGVETGETRKFRGQVRKNNKGQLVVYDSNLQNDHPLSNLIDLHEAGKGSLKRITKEEVDTEIENQIIETQNRERAKEIVKAGKKLRTAINSLKDKIDLKEVEILYKIEEIQKLKAELSNKNEVEYKLTKNRIESLNKQISSLKTQITNLEEEKKELEETIDRGYKALNEIPLRNRAFVKAELEAKKSALNSINNILKSLRDLVYGLSKELNKLKETVLFIFPNYGKAIRRGRHEETKFREDLREREKRINDLEKTIYANISIKNKLKEDISKLERELQLMDNIADSIRNSYTQPQKEKKDFQDKHPLDNDEEITTDELEASESKKLDKQTFRPGLAKPDLATTAGNDIQQVGEGKFIEDFVDEDGEIVLNDDENQQRWFNYLRDPNNNFESGEYSLQVSVDNSEEAKLIEEETGEPVIKAVLMHKGDVVKVNGKTVWTVLHTSKFAKNTQKARKIGNESDEQVETKFSIEIEEHDTFRNKIIKSNKPLYVKITGKSNGLIVFAKTKEDGTRAKFSILGRLATDIKDLASKLFVSNSIGGTEPKLDTSPNITKVGRNGKVYIMVKTPSGKMMPVMLQTRSLTGDELNLAIKILKLQISNRNKDVSSKLHDILKQLIYIPSFKNRDKNPEKNLYFSKGKLIFGLNEMSLEDFNDEANVNKLKEWLLKNKSHQVSNTLIKENKKFVKTIDIDEKGNNTKWETYDSYLDYLVGDKYVLTTDKETKEKTYTNRKSEPVLTTDVVQNNKFVSMYAKFDRNLLEEDPSKKTKEQEAVDNAPTSTEIYEKDEPDFTEDNIPQELNEYLDDDDIITRTSQSGPISIKTVEEELEKLNKAKETKEEEDKPDSSILNDEDLYAHTVTNTEWVSGDLKKEEAWFRERFPHIKFVTVKILERLHSTGEYVHGVFTNAMVRINELAEEGTVYHEAFHVVSQMFLTKKQRQKLYNEIRKESGNPTVKDLEKLQRTHPSLNNEQLIDRYFEEILAEKFRTWKLNREKLKLEKETKNFFQTIVEFIKNFFNEITGNVTYLDVFKNIEKGKYKTIIKENLPGLKGTLFTHKLQEIELEEEQALMNQLSLIVLNKLINRGNSISMINNAINASKKEKERHPALIDILNTIYKEIGPTHGKIVKDGKTFFEAFGGKIGNYAVNNWDKVVSEHKNHLKKYSLEVKSEKDTNDSLEQELEKQKEHWEKESAKYSTNDGMAPNIRLLIGSLIEKDSKGKPIINEHHLNEPVDPDKTYNWMLSKLVGLTRYDDMIKVLESYSSTKPFINDFISKLNLPSSEEAKIKLRTDFVQTFAKTKHNYITMLIDPATGNIYPVNSNANKVEDSIRNNWEQNFRVSKNSTIKDGQIILSKQAAEEILLLDDLKLLSALGIRFTNESLINTQSSIFVDSMAAIKTFIKDEVIKKDKPITSLFKSASVKYENSISNRLNALVKMQAEQEDTITELQFINSEGETVYEITLNSTLSTIINDAKNGYPLIQDLYNTNSKYLPLLNEGKISITILDGLRQDKTGAEGIHVSDTKETDLISIRINAGLNNNPVYTLPTTGDKKQQFGIAGFPPVNKNFITEADNNYEFDQEVIEQMYDYFLDERARILNDNGSEVDVYSKKRKEFSIFESILTQETKDALGKDLKLNAKVDKLIERDINNYFNDKIKENISYLQEQKILTKNEKGDIRNRGISKELVKNYNSINHAIATFTISDLFAKIEMIKLFTGDLAFYKDFPKRTPGLIATGKVAIVDDVLNDYIERTTNFKNPEHKKKVDGTFKVLGLKDRKVVSIYIKQYIEEFQKDILKRKNISKEEALEEAKKQAKAYSEINDADAVGLITIEEYREFLLRTSDWGEAQERLYKAIKSGKPIHPEERAMFQMLKPVSYGKTVRKDNLNVPGYLKFSLLPLIPQMIEGTELENKLNEMYEKRAGMAVYHSGTKAGFIEGISTYDYKFTKIQVDNKPYNTLDQKLLFGTQSRILIAQNQRGLQQNGEYKDSYENTYELDGKMTSFSDVYNQYKLANEELVEREAKELYNRIYDESGNLKHEEFLTLIKEQLKGKSTPSNLIDALGYDNKIKDFVIPFDLLTNREKISNVINALFENNITKQKMPGDMKVQTSVAGFERKDVKLLTQKEIEEQFGNDFSKQIDYGGTGRLQGTHIKDGKVKPMQVLLPAWMANMDFTNLDKAARTLIGYRIPTTGINSIETIEVAGFLPHSAGSTVVIAAETVAKSGTDFDFDKLNLFIPKVKFNKETNKWEKVQYDTTISLSDNSKDQIKNRIIDLMTSILQNPNNFAQLITSVGPDLIKQDSDKIKELQGLPLKDNKSQTEYIEFKANIKSNIRFLGSKVGVAQMAGQITHHIQSQLADLYIKNGTQFFFEHNKNKEGFSSLAGILDINNDYISDALNAYAQAYVDAAKDPFIMDLNGNSITADTSSMMIRLGAGYQFVNRFMTQPILLEYIKEIHLSESEVLKPHNDLYRTNKSRIEYIRAKYLNKLSDANRLLYNNAAYNLKDSQPEKLPNIFSSYRTLTINDLEEGLKSVTLDEKQALLQLQVLDNFLFYQDTAKSLREAMKASSDTTKGSGKNLNESQQIVEIKNKVIQDDVIGNFDKLFENTFLGKFEQYGAKYALELQKSLFVTQKQEIKDIVKQINILSNNEFKQDLKVLDRITNDVIGFILNTYNKVTKQQIKDLLIDKRNDKGVIINKSVAREITDIQTDKHHPLHNNYLFDLRNKLIEVQLSDKINTPNVIKITSKKVTPSTHDRIVEGFRRLNRVNPELCQKIIKVGWYQSGLNNSAVNFLKFVPAEIHADMNIKAINEFKLTSKIDKQKFIKDFYRSNRFNENLVPRIYSSKDRIHSVGPNGDYIILANVEKNQKASKYKWLMYYHSLSSGNPFEEDEKRPQLMQYLGNSVNNDGKPVYVRISTLNTGYSLSNEYNIDSKTIVDANEVNIDADKIKKALMIEGNFQTNIQYDEEIAPKETPTQVVDSNKKIKEQSDKEILDSQEFKDFYSMNTNSTIEEAIEYFKKCKL